MSPTRESFECWWSDRNWLFGAYAPQLKEAVWLAFADGWDRSKKEKQDVD